MVNLHKFYETSSTIYLLLQYASGGKLWDYVGAYLRYAQEQVREGGPGMDDGYPAQEFQNVYTGYKVHQDNNKRASFIGCHVKHSPTDTPPDSVKDVQYKKETDDVLLHVPSSNAVKDLSVDDFQLDFQNTCRVSLDDTGIQAPGPNVSAIDEVVDEDSASEENKKHVQYSRFTSFSSEENADDDDAGGVSNPNLDRQNSSGAQFQDLLHKNTNKAALENFSINSFDSTEGVPRIDSNVSDHIEVIHEVSEGQGETEVFNQVKPENSGLESLVTEADPCSSAAEQSLPPAELPDTNGLGLNLSLGNNKWYVRSESEISDNNKSCDEKSTACDSENDIIQSSKELLKSVERTLSQIEVQDKIAEDSATPNSQEKLTPVVLPTESFEEPSIYDLHGDTSDSQSDTRSQGHDGSRPASCEVAQNGDSGSLVHSLSPDHKKGDITNIEGTCISEPSSRHNSESRSRSSTGVTARKLTLPRLNSTELSRSASSEQESRSPSKARKRTISQMFEQLDLTVQNPDQVKIPESFIRRWAAEIIVAIATLHSLGVICK